jgi:hypothetical protein
MQLRRLTVAVLAAAIPILALAGPASAATYPPGVPTTQRTVVPGVVYGGDATGAQVIDTCSGDHSATVAEGAPFVIRVCGWAPGTGVTVSVTAPGGTPKTLDTIPAKDDGSVTTGALRLDAPGTYSFSFRGVGGATAQGLGVGGVGSRGASRVFADPNRTVAVSITVPTAGNLPHTGGDGGGTSAATWGLALVGFGLLVVLGVRLRRQARRAHA